MTDLIDTFLKAHRIEGAEDLPTLLSAVATIPWGEGRTIEEVLQTKKMGTCTGKHLVLQECCQALNIPFRPVTCTFRWGEQSISYPPGLRCILREGEWGHGHNFIQLKRGNQWIDTDVTWDPFLRPFGFRVFPLPWNGGGFVGVDHIVQRWDGVSASEKKRELMESLTPELFERRERFLRSFFQWIDALRKGGGEKSVTISPIRKDF